MQLGMSGNQTHVALDISRGAVQDCIKRAKIASITWEQVCALSDQELEDSLYPIKKIPAGKSEDSELDWLAINKELKRRGVTKRLLWEEMFAVDPYCLSYSQFCRRYNKWHKKTDVSMRQEHKAGQKLFVDYAGQTMPIVDRDTGEVTEAQIFVATFGASNYTYFEASESQKSAHWLAAHVRAFKFFGGLPEQVICDNLKSAVTNACRQDRVLNRSYQRLANHYNIGVSPARPVHPQDKAKVEAGVKFVENRALAKLRDFTFFSVDHLNDQLYILTKELNNEPFQQLPGTRASWFESLDKPALKPLPDYHFELEEWKLNIRVPKDYHVNIDDHYYSVPYKLVGERVDARLTDHTIEILHDTERAASHVRSWAIGQSTTVDEHRTPAHAKYAEMSPEMFIAKAGQIGPKTKFVVETLLNAKPQPQLSYDVCFGIIKSLKNKYGAVDLELACSHAVHLQTVGYRVIKSILERGVHSMPEQLSLRLGNNSHENLRGPDTYH